MDNDDKAPKGKLPGTGKELAVYRKPNVRAKSLLERLDTLISKTWGKDPKLHAVLTTRVFNGSSVEGTPLYDKAASAIYIRQLAFAEGDTELGELPLATLSRMVGSVLRRFDFAPLSIE